MGHSGRYYSIVDVTTNPSEAAVGTVPTWMGGAKTITQVRKSSKIPLGR